MTDETYVCWRATDGPGGSLPAGLGSNFVNWSETELTDELQHDNLPTGTTFIDFLDALQEDRIIVALSTQNTYVPYS